MPPTKGLGDLTLPGAMNWTKISFPLLGIFLVPVVLELVFRLYINDTPLYRTSLTEQQPLFLKSSDSRGYEMRANYAAYFPSTAISINTNSRGFRDVEHKEEKTPGVCRIALLGDSVAFGWSLNFEQTLSRRLSAALPNPHDVEVLNLAVGGYDTEQEVATLMEEGVRFKPDIVLVAFVLNDFEPYRDNFVRWHTSHSGSYAFDFLNFQFQMLRSKFGDSPVKRGFEKLSNARKIHNFRPLLVIFPYFERTNEGKYPYEKFHAKVRGLARQNGLDVLDLGPEFYKADLAVVSEDVVHPNAKGIELAARAISSYLQKNFSDTCPKLSGGVDGAGLPN